jgi:hypothetical protein
MIYQLQHQLIFQQVQFQNQILNYQKNFHKHLAMVHPKVVQIKNNEISLFNLLENYPNQLQYMQAQYLYVYLGHELVLILTIVFFRINVFHLKKKEFENLR